MNRSYNILVIGDDARSFLSVVRSLARDGHVVGVIMHRYNPVSAASKYIRQIHKLAPVALDADKWLDAIDLLQQRHRYDLIIPCDDSAMLPFIMLLDGGDYPSLKKCAIATPGNRAFKLFADKTSTHAACLKLGIPVARQMAVSAGVLETISYPVALKPKCSFSLDNLLRKETVQILRCKVHAAEVFEKLAEPTGYFLEEYFDGVGVGVSIAAKNGKVIDAFQHVRLDEGVSGGSSLRQSEVINPDMLEYVEQLAEHAQLEGVAMFEFRRNRRTGKFILLEVNARVWGSLPLAIYAGVDFPAVLVRNTLGSANDTVEKQLTPYRKGVTARALTPSVYDILRKAGKGGVVSGGLRLFADILLALVRTLIFREKIDSFSFDDSSPFWREVSLLRRTIVGGVTKRIGLSGALRRRRAKKLLKKATADRGSLHHILFLCYGNICRSPFAEKAMVEALVLAGGASAKDYTVKSAGFHMAENRSSPVEAIYVAGALCLPLDNHQSSYARAADIEEADLIVYFDEKNGIDMEAYYPEALGRSLNFGDFLASPSDIMDPYGQSEEGFRHCYNRISEATEKLALELGGLNENS